MNETKRFRTWLRPGSYLRGEREYRAGAEPLLLDAEEIAHFRRCGLLLRCEMPEGDQPQTDKPVRRKRGRPRRNA